ncbi:MAG: UvrD-helicase domain-containing protein [Fibrobacter sp.]|nr:UvrD-helicase domain-containing protein [Fibrobacter sp.]
MKNFNINDYQVNQNLFIEASAGTGKTFTIELLAEKLVNSGIPLSKILIVTYTEKATGELRDRIRQKMEKCLAEKLKKGEDASQFRKAMQDVHSAPIYTIHSFCQSTLRSFAYEAQAPLNLEVVSDSGIMNLIEKNIRDSWAALPEFRDIVYDPTFDMDAFKEKCQNAVTKYALSDNIQLDMVQYHTFQDLIDNYPGFKENWDIVKANEDKVNVKNKAMKQFVEALESWTSTNGKIFNAKTFSSKVWQGVWNEPEVNAAMDFFYDMQKSFDAKKESPSNSEVFIFNHLDEIFQEWETYKKNSKLQSFNNMIHSVRDAVLQEDSELVKRLRETYRLAIIDEFQDTNQNQWDIFRTVFQSGGQNNLLVVGDPKQSIFSFQGADLNVYQKAIQSYDEDCGKELQENNRSTDDMIQACNEIFKQDFFVGQGFTEAALPPANRKKLPPTLNGNPVEPLWALYSETENGVELETFAKYAITKILECCTEDENGHTALQVYDKDKKALVDVRFSDFAILARTRSEMEEIEALMSKVGIPYTRYKDQTLFYGHEALHWISILSAIDAPDFSGHNKNLYNQALLSDFFRIPLEDLSRIDFSNPQQEPMSLFIQWRKLARNRKWAELQERIYHDTRIDEFLGKPSTLQSLAKIRQIGSYIFDYLYNNRVSLEEAVKHLKGISSFNEKAENDDGAYIAKDGDFDAVQVMTIFASKGLAFPVTIVVGGRKTHNNRIEGPYLYNRDGVKHLGFQPRAESLSKAETEVEWRRLIYVSHTRAQSLMILPRYKRSDRVTHPFQFLDARMDAMKDSKYIRPDQKFTNDDWNLKKAILQAQKILADFAKKDQQEDSTIDQQKDVVEKLQKSLGSLSIFQYSYSSLSNKKKAKEAKIQKVQDIPEDSVDDISNNDGSRTNKEESSGTSNVKVMTIDIDDASKVVKPCEHYDKKATLRKLSNYPRGAKLGNALHESFEHVDFVRFGNIPTEEEAINDAETRTLIEERFVGQSFPMNRHSDWTDLTAKFVWHTLNAKLPEIHGSSATGAEFCLNQLEEKDRKAEMEFRLNAQFRDWLNRFCKGFIDLLFVRHDQATGRDYYSILDWKSDVLEDEGYSDGKAVFEKVTEEYSVQRVLYSYCLIQWLKQFMPEKSEEQIFEDHFGGIYYAFARGCEAGTCNGIYAQTWENYAALAESYKHVVGLMG